MCFSKLVSYLQELDDVTCAEDSVGDYEVFCFCRWEIRSKDALIDDTPSTEDLAGSAGTYYLQ